MDTEEMLRQSQKMEAVGQLTGGIAHDFNNLLTIVIGHIERLEKQFRDNPAVYRSIKGAMDGASRGAAETQKLLAFGRRQPLSPMRLNANLLIESMADLLRRAVGERVDVDLKLYQGLWPVEVDHNQLENALINLAVNARDAMPDGGRLTIQSQNASNPAIDGGTTLDGQFIVLTVSDDGVGMSDDVLAHAFEPFFTTKPVGEGTGLGLSQVYGFVKQTNGHVDIHSEGRGTTLRIYLPRARRHAESAPSAPPAIPVGATVGQAG